MKPDPHSLARRLRDSMKLSRELAAAATQMKNVHGDLMLRIACLVKVNDFEIDLIFDDDGHLMVVWRCKRKVKDGAITDAEHKEIEMMGTVLKQIGFLYKKREVTPHDHRMWFVIK